MSIYRIKICNYKCLKDITINLSDLNLFVGENGTGKTNILTAIQYFYSNLIYDNTSQDIFDINNTFSNAVQICLYFDLNKAIKIARNNQSKNFNYSGYYDQILSLTDNGRKTKISLTLLQIKNQAVDWILRVGESPNRAACYNERILISSLFPLYYIDSRNVPLNNWETIWSNIADLNKLSNSDTRKIVDKIKSALEEINGDSYKKLSEVFLNSQLEVKKYKPKEIYELISKIYYEGKEFRFNSNSLSYHSSGTNSLNYLLVLMNLINLIAKTKLKFPVLLLDEPEIGLHHMNIDRIAERLELDKDEYRILLSTHSSRLVKDMLRNKNVNIYSVRNFKKYTVANLTNLFDVRKSRKDFESLNIITDDHANSYFSRAMILVEGASELEMLQNEYINILFNNLRFADCYDSISNENIQNIVSPSRRNMKTPYIVLKDMDKCFKSPNAPRSAPYRIKYSLASDFCLNDNEVFYYNHKYRPKREAILKQRYRIETICKNEEFEFNNNWLTTTKDSDFFKLLNMIKAYNENYNTFICYTTIEGMIVNEKSVDIFYLFLLERRLIKKNLRNLWEAYSDINLRVTLLRLFCKGKTDALVNAKHLILNNDEKEALKSSFSKTSGWISDFFEFYFKYILLKLGKNVNISEDIKLYLKKNDVQNEIKQIFAEDFAELNDFLSLSNSLVNDII